MKKFIKYCTLFIIPFVFSVILLFNLPYDKKFAYHYIEDNCFHRSNWLYDRIFENNTPIDIAFMGTSHTLNSVQDSLLSQFASDQVSYEMHIANLGFCWQGYNAQYVILKDLFQNKQPKIVVIEVREWTENDNHLLFPYMALEEDIVFQPYFTKLECISNLYTAGLARWEYFRFGFRNLDLQNASTNVYGYVPRGDVISNKEVLSQRHFQEKRFAAEGTHLNNMVRQFDRFYLNKMIELCLQNNAEIYFLYLPGYGDILGRPIDDEFYYGDHLLIPDREIFYDISNWSNSSHFNDKGALELTRWLMNTILFESK